MAPAAAYVCCLYIAINAYGWAGGMWRRHVAQKRGISIKRKAALARPYGMAWRNVASSGAKYGIMYRHRLNARSKQHKHRLAHLNVAHQHRAAITHNAT